jgi:hypothetical protein
VDRGGAGTDVLASVGARVRVPTSSSRWRWRAVVALDRGGWWMVDGGWWGLGLEMAG